MNSVYFKAFDSKQCEKFINPRKGERKFGEKIDFPENRSIENFLEQTSAKYILLGIEEDIGVQANLGRSGTRMAWENTLKSLLNIQHKNIAKAIGSVFWAVFLLMIYYLMMFKKMQKTFILW